MSEIIVKAEKRNTKTKGELSTLRNNKRVPGVYYIKGQEPISITVDEYAINSLVFTSEQKVVNLQIEETEHKCIVKDVQFDPVSDKVIHFDLLGLTAGQKLQLEIPLQFVGKAPGIKEGGHLQHFMHKLDVECLPRHIPDTLEVDVSGLHIGDTIHVADVSFENIEILNSPESVIVTMLKPRELEEEAAPELEDEEEMKEPEVIGKGKSAEDSEEDE